jgi:hypothetical protein
MDKSINFIIGYALGKIQQFWLGMHAENHPFDGSVVAVPKQWIGSINCAPETYCDIIQTLERLFDELVDNYRISIEAKVIDCYVEFHYVITKLPNVKKMTVADIEKELGYKIEIISE